MTENRLTIDILHTCQANTAGHTQTVILKDYIMDYKAQANTAVTNIKQLGILGDAVTAKNTGDLSGLAYIVGMALNTRDPIKWGLLFAVGDLLAK